jgi:hypothetical protein
MGRGADDSRRALSLSRSCTRVATNTAATHSCSDSHPLTCISRALSLYTQKAPLSMHTAKDLAPTCVSLEHSGACTHTYTRRRSGVSFFIYIFILPSRSQVARAQVTTATCFWPLREPYESLTRALREPLREPYESLKTLKALLS